ncbi:unnamed protein product [Ilex paraguariensis]|uniref:Uncharacterized protein n=1 Tax=Ilex paraguariensis TaxID=185542 RepID=A0ABC8SPT4_9AQUA
MTNLQQKMRQMEYKCDEVRKEIRKLDEKLESLTRTTPSSSDQLEATYLSVVPESNNKTWEKRANVTVVSPSELPRFMRPKICGRRKSGIDHQPSKEKDLVPARRRRALSHRAESDFPHKDNETQYSRDTSAYDLKMDVLPEQDKLPSINHPKDHFIASEDHGDRTTNNSLQFLKVKY